MKQLFLLAKSSHCLPCAQHPDQLLMLSDARLVASAKASESKLELLHLQHSSFTFFFGFLATIHAANLAALSIAGHHYAFLWIHSNCINLILSHCFIIKIMGITRYKPTWQDIKKVGRISHQLLAGGVSPNYDPIL